MTVTFSLRTKQELVEQLDHIAEVLDRNRNWVINDAIQHYIELKQWQMEEISKGEEDIKAGRWLTTDQIRFEIAELDSRSRSARRKTKVTKSSARKTA